ncbi:metalloregulator ArsR/SmtB family transcription factor [Pseudooceanicola sp. 216_PA32_1]|uniref:Metalloregulator ArsR/SmtB family transcription factor n=1 Tax=Pseudooceanicola pacificus TaxID=2676438 RepID=A0A844VZ82_9RHOB|nr:metalloregulator ArsR/SmtB family transcription factor [Pseudooceanicola pacificus]MWB76697.1 metalloregulator ArsR/SmtB family transcription factor [Pseudooceanicola pacificus]
MTDLTRTFAALADTTRLSLVEYLMRNGEQPASALAGLTDISAPAVSRHLKVLREAGLLHQRVAGTHRYYSVRPEAMRLVSDWTIDHRAFWAGSLDRLDTLLALDPEGEDE